MNYNVIMFYSSHFIFQDHVSGKMIELAKEKNRLYYLRAQLQHTPLVKDPMSESLLLISIKDAIWHHHFSFGHPSFSILKIMFSFLFNNVDFETFHCDICKFTKQKKKIFSIRNNRSSFPFCLVPTDIGGPSRVPNVIGS